MTVSAAENGFVWADEQHLGKIGIFRFRMMKPWLLGAVILDSNAMGQKIDYLQYKSCEMF